MAHSTNEIPTVESTISNKECFTKGTVVGLAFGCIMATLVVTVLLGLVVLYYIWRKKKQNVGNSENGGQSGSNGHCVVYDNTQFKLDEQSDADRNAIVQNSTIVTVNEQDLSGGTDPLNCEKVDKRNAAEKTTESKMNGHIFGSSSWSPRKRSTSINSSVAKAGYTVRIPLKSKDYSGLGFTIEGNSANGIYVKSLSNCGPAKESGQIVKGDRLLGVKISFENMVYEDALTILSYASPYPLCLKIEKTNSIRNKDSNFINETTMVGRCVKFHPLFKSPSLSNVSSARGGLDDFLNNSISSESKIENETKKSNLEQILNTSEILNQKNKPDNEISDQLSITILPPTKNVVEILNCDCSMNLAEIKPSVLTRTTSENLIEDFSEMRKTSGNSNTDLASQSNQQVQNCVCAHNGISTQMQKAVKWYHLDDDQSADKFSRSRSEEELNKATMVSATIRSSTSMTNGISIPNDIRVSKRDSGYGTLQVNEKEVEIEQEQFDKLLYFQSQLARQHEELKSLGIDVPTPTFLPISRLDF